MPLADKVTEQTSLDTTEIEKSLSQTDTTELHHATSRVDLLSREDFRRIREMHDSSMLNLARRVFNKKIATKRPHIIPRSDHLEETVLANNNKIMIIRYYDPKKRKEIIIKITKQTEDIEFFYNFGNRFELIYKNRGSQVLKATITAEQSSYRRPLPPGRRNPPDFSDEDYKRALANI